MFIKIYRKSQYGRIRFYPMCPISRTLTYILERKALTQPILDILRQQGWKIEEVKEPKKDPWTVVDEIKEGEG